MGEPRRRLKVWQDFRKKACEIRKNITKAYKAAQRLGNGSVTIKGNQKHGVGDVAVTGNEVAGAMGGATLRANYHKDKIGADGSTAGADRDNRTITFNTKAFDRTDSVQSRITLHESFHLIDSTIGWKEPVYLRFPHQKPFDKAAEDILAF